MEDRNKEISEMVLKALVGKWSASLRELARLLEHRASFEDTFSVIKKAYEADKK